MENNNDACVDQEKENARIVILTEKNITQLKELLKELNELIKRMGL